MENQENKLQQAESKYVSVPQDQLTRLLDEHTKLSNGVEILHGLALCLLTKFSDGELFLSKEFIESVTKSNKNFLFDEAENGIKITLVDTEDNKKGE